MIASLAALHLLLAAPLSTPPGPLAGALAQAGETPPSPGDAVPPDPAAPPDGAAPEAPPPGAAPVEPSPPPAAAPPPVQSRALRPVAAPVRQRFPSFQGAETLGGSSAAGAWAGWSSFGGAWAMGVTSEDDAGAFGDYDWSKSELRLGGLYRRALATSGGFDIAFRLTLAWYVNLGSTYVYSENHSERGVEAGPGLVASQRAAGGLFSVSADGPLTITTKYRTGLLFSPRFGLAYETVLYPQLTVGARIGAGYRAGSGDAPLRTGRGELQFLVLAGYQLL